MTFKQNGTGRTYLTSKLSLEIQNLESSKFYLSLHTKIFWYGGGQVTQLFNTLSNTSCNSAVKRTMQLCFQDKFMD